MWQNSGGQQSASVRNTPSQEFQTANQELQQTLANLGAPAPAAPAPKPTPAPAPAKPAGLYANGSYTGSPADAYYGTVQVKVVVQSGKIADVQFLQYPNDRSTSLYINGQAMPMLTQEAIQAQSAQVSGVSGATATSDAFVQSLASALALAQN
ncbi:FMN-binding protein [Patescibacteria group bacterium]|nr:FMN-binding protein [Patescibacteria group bacterium]